MFNWWGMSFVLHGLTDVGGGWPLEAYLSGHWLSCSGCWQYLLNMKYAMYGILFLFYPSPCDVSVHELPFSKIDWTNCHGPSLYQIYILNSANANITYSGSGSKEDRSSLLWPVNIETISNWDKTDFPPNDSPKYHAIGWVSVMLNCSSLPSI